MGWVSGMLLDQELVGVALPAIPRLLVGLSEWAAVASAIPISRRRLSWPRTIAALLVALVAQVFLRCSNAGYENHAVFVFYMVVNVVAMLLWLWILVDESPANLLFLWLVVFLLAELAASLSWQVCTLVLGAPSLVHADALVMSLSVVALVVAVSAMAVRKLGLRVDALGWSYVAIAAGVVVLVFIASNANVFREGIWKGHASPELAAMIGWVRTVSDLCGIVILWMMLRVAKESQLRHEVQVTNQLMESQYRQYLAFRDSNDFVRQQCHDLKHQIAVLREEGALRQDYLDEMERGVRVFQTQCDTGNHVLDTVLTQKLRTCEQRGVTLQWMADARPLDAFDSRDLAILFGNLLDNALEATEGLPQEMRVVSLEVRPAGGFVSIVVENPCDHPVTIRDGLPQTTKRDAMAHGVGTRSIRSIAERNGGSAEFSFDGSWFVAAVLLPVS